MHAFGLVRDLLTPASFQESLDPGRGGGGIHNVRKDHGHRPIECLEIGGRQAARVESGNGSVRPSCR